MKQKATATIIILTLILITSLLLPNQNTIIPIIATTTPTTKNTPITGQGADTNATLIITGNTTEPGSGRHRKRLQHTMPTKLGNTKHNTNNNKHNSTKRNNKNRRKTWRGWCKVYI
ncbi:MAG: hypothetical protein QW297_06335 [Candidatus Jordarchaeales archaeon]